MAGSSATTVCTRGPPSDQDSQGCAAPPIDAVGGAERSTLEPSIDRQQKGADPGLRTSAERQPRGIEAIVRSTLRGRISTVVEAERPRESVAVRVSSICAG